MTFRMTVRDYHNVAGCTDEDDVVVTTNSNAGPFIITSQNTGATWYEGTLQTITWNVANTTASPVSCANVDIRLSYDGGFTYPGVLSLNETNDGSAVVTIPVGLTSTGRVMVKGSNNIFFDINNQNITLSECQLTVTLTTGTGPGTLPEAVNCANVGDTIFLSPSLTGQTINVGLSPLFLTKSITIMAQAPNINITGSGSCPFEIAQQTTIELNGAIITAGTSMTAGAILNQGNLTLKNITIEKNTNINGAILIGNMGGNLTLNGTCSISQ